MIPYVEQRGSKACSWLASDSLTEAGSVTRKYSWLKYIEFIWPWRDPCQSPKLPFLFYVLLQFPKFVAFIAIMAPENAISMVYTGLPSRMRGIIATIIPKIAVTFAERNSADPPKVDFATAANWRVRDEVVAIYNEAVARDLYPEVNDFSSRFISHCIFLSILSSMFTLRIYSNLLPSLRISLALEVRATILPSSLPSPPSSMQTSGPRFKCYPRTSS